MHPYYADTWLVNHCTILSPIHYTTPSPLVTTASKMCQMAYCVLGIMLGLCPLAVFDCKHIAPVHGYLCSISFQPQQLGNTALHLACKLGAVDIIKILCGYNADTSIQNKKVCMYAVCPLLSGSITSITNGTVSKFPVRSFQLNPPSFYSLL